MIIDWQNISIYVQPGVTDMRKQINGLSIIVEEELKKNVFSGNLFLFCNRTRNRLKILYWDSSGFCLWLKRLETDKFPWPRNEKEVKEITLEELKMLLKGIDFFHVHKKLDYTEVA